MARGEKKPSVTRALKYNHGSRLVLWIFSTGVVLVLAYSVVFQFLMAREGQSHTWPDAVYWTITTMSTLGYGDVTFQSELGRMFSMLVLLSGILLIVVLLPFSFVQFVVAPWMHQREADRAPRSVPTNVQGHIILAGLDVVTQTLVARAKRSGRPTVVIVEDTNQAVRLHDEGYRAMVGSLDSPETYRKARVEQAAMVTSTQADTTNSNVAFTVRQVDQDVTIAVTAQKKASVDVLELAGANHVLRLAPTLGRELAQRSLGTTGRPHVIGHFGETHIAEAAARGTALVGKTVAEAQQHMNSNLRILATMRLGRLGAIGTEEPIDEKTVLIIAANSIVLEEYEAQFRDKSKPESPVLIVGGGQVGQAAAKEFEKTGVPYTIVEKVPGRTPSHLNVVEGDAAELNILREAGLDEAAAVLVTSHDDDLNVYLTLYCRRLRPQLQVVSRATYERNVATQYRAGADNVLSYATIGATALWNNFGPDHRVVIAEGNELFPVPIPSSLAGTALFNLKIYEETGCRIVAVTNGDKGLLPTTERIPTTPDHKLLLLGDRHAERAFRHKYLRERG
ncbi:MAG: NAD-binding protein [Yaniella sp.]|nr:NAD-binding protein [Yaniella sp.]